MSVNVGLTPTVTLFFLHGMACGLSPERLTLVFLTQHLVPGRRDRRAEVKDLKGKGICLLYVKPLVNVLHISSYLISTTAS